MKKLIYMSALLIALISFEGCYSGREVISERQSARVVVVPARPYYRPYVYRPAPRVIIQPSYGKRYGYNNRNRYDYDDRGRRR